MPWTFYSILHFVSLLLLTGLVFAVFGGAPESGRKRLLMAGGLLSLLVLVGGFGLAARKLGLANPLGWPAWLWVKVGCWLWLSAVGGLTFRRRAQTPRWVLLTAAVIGVAVTMAVLKPWV